MTVAVDVRMVRASGIGAYIRRLLPSVIRATPEIDWLLVGNPAVIAQTELRGLGTVLPYDLPMYSLRHHLEMPKLLGTRAELLWTPHFNAPATRSVRHIATIHDVVHLARPEFFPGVARRLVARLWYRRTVRQSRTLVTGSRFTASEIARFFPAAAHKTSVIYNFVERGYSQFTPVPVPEDRPYFLTVGNIKPHKNVATLLAAFELVRDRLDSDLVIVGQAEGFITGDRTVARAMKASGERIRFTGYVELDELKSLYAKATCAVFPSHYEGFGLGPLEAMTMGCPVIAADIPATREVCAEAALTFDPYSPEQLGERLVEALMDPGLRTRLAQAGKLRSEAFSPEESIARTVELIRNTVNS